MGVYGTPSMGVYGTPPMGVWDTLHGGVWDLPPSTPSGLFGPGPNMDRVQKVLKMGVFYAILDPFLDPFGTRICGSGVLFSGHPCISGDLASTGKWVPKWCILGQKWVKKVSKTGISGHFIWHRGGFLQKCPENDDFSPFFVMG